MGIISTLTFQPRSFNSIVRLLCTLPDELRATHHSVAEHGKRRPIPDDIEEYLNAPPGKERGTFLRGGANAGRGRSAVIYNISGISSTWAGAMATCGVSFNKMPSPALVKEFLVHMAKAEPIFGYVCALEERRHRNKIDVRWEGGGAEFFIGCDTEKFLPGFYWMTLVSDTLIKQHDIPIAVVKEAAEEYQRLETGQHFFRFYDKPGDWENTSKVTELCATLPNLFNIEPVRAAAMLTKNSAELHVITDPWR